MADTPPRDLRITVLKPAVRGRPKAEDPKTTLSTWVKATHYDQIVRMANEQEKSVSALVRDLLTLRLK